MRICITNQEINGHYSVRCIENKKIKYRVTVYSYHDIGAVISVWLSKGERLSAWFPSER